MFLNKYRKFIQFLTNKVEEYNISKYEQKEKQCSNKYLNKISQKLFTHPEIQPI